MSTTIFRSIAACDIGKNDSQIRARLPGFGSRDNGYYPEYDLPRIIETRPNLPIIV
jgi:hypothetical protein